MDCYKAVKKTCGGKVNKEWRVFGDRAEYFYVSSNMARRLVLSSYLVNL